MSRAPRAGGRVALAILFIVMTGCRQGMYNQPRLKPLAASDFYDDGQAARPPIPDTVARGTLQLDRALATGLGADGRFVTRLPIPLTRARLERGRERYDIYCSPCHGRTGDGRGMIVQRGFKAPPSYQIDRLRAQPIGYLFDVMTNGFGEMSSYAGQVPVEDRWAIAAYIRALQLSQHAPLGALPERDRQAIEASGVLRVIEPADGGVMVEPAESGKLGTEEGR